MARGKIRGLLDDPPQGSCEQGHLWAEPLCFFTTGEFDAASHVSCSEYVQMHTRATATPAAPTTEKETGPGGFYSSVLQRKQTLTEGPSPVLQGRVLKSLASLSSQRSWLREVLWRISFLPSVSLRCENRETRSIKTKQDGRVVSAGNRSEMPLWPVRQQPSHTSLEAFSQSLGELQCLHFL